MSVLSDLGASNAVIKTLAFESLQDLIFINKFYPYGVAPTGASQTPQSLGYATIGTYIAALPAAYQAAATSFSGYVPAVTDQCDLIAWQTASNYVYDRNSGTSSGDNFSSGHFIASGQYVVNKGITLNHAAMKIEGVNPTSRFAIREATSITYNGTGGTIDAPVAIFDCWLFDEFFLPPPGRLNNTVQSGGIKAMIDGIAFNGKGGSIISASQNVSAYVSGVRIRKGAFVQIANCSFGGCLYDGIYVTDAQLFFIVERNFFFGVHRDGIAILKNYAAVTGNFSTTVWIYNNEFGYIGRYAILQDLNGSVEAAPITRDNSFEHAEPNSYYVLHPEWFIHGIKAGVCYMNAGNLVDSASRYEGVTLQGYTATILLINSTGATIENGEVNVVAVSAHSAAQNRTNAAIAYCGSAATISGITKANPAVVTATSHGFIDGNTVHVYNVSGMKQVNGGPYTVANKTANTFELQGVNSSAYTTYTSGGRAATGPGYLDITDARSYRCASTGDVGTRTEDLTLRKLLGLSYILMPDGNCLGTSGIHTFENVIFNFWYIPTTNASAHEGKVITQLSTALPVYGGSGPNTCNFRNVYTGLRRYGHYDQGSGNGDAQLIGSTTAGISAWVANTAYFATFGSSGAQSIIVRQWVVPTAGNWTGYLYQCTVAGTSHATTEPTWPTTVGNTVVDGTVTWTCIAQCYLDSENLVAERIENTKRVRRASAAPTVGRFAIGDRVTNSLPAAGSDATYANSGIMGWICTTAGLPGTWRQIKGIFNA